MLINNHPLFPELRSMVSKVMGLDQVIESILNIKRKIRSLVLTSEEFKGFEPALQNRPNFLVWERQGDT